MAKKKSTTATKKKSTTEKSKTGFNPSDEAVRDGEHINFDALDEVEAAALAGGAAHASPILPSPSSLANPYMSEEDQGVEMTAQVVGPPAYGSPEPATSAGRLLPLNEHPLNAEALPEGHPAAISPEYGEGYGRTVTGGRPSRPDLEGGAGDFSVDSNAEANATKAARELADEYEVDLRAVTGTGENGRVGKNDVEEYLVAREEEAAAANNGDDD